MLYIYLYESNQNLVMYFVLVCCQMVVSVILFRMIGRWDDVGDLTVFSATAAERSSGNVSRRATVLSSVV